MRTTRIHKSTQEPHKGLVEILKKHSGRDSSGRISVRHQGGRQKRYYRIIDFKRNKYDQVGVVESIEYDPNRNVFISLIKYSDGEKRYILHPKDIKVGDKVASGVAVDIKPGNALPLKNIPIGQEVHNVEMRPGQGGKVVRGAGNVAIIIARDETFVHLKLPSGEVKKFPQECYATVGALGNSEFRFKTIGKAGRKRHMGIRPTVRGTAQNPRSHPHGGGEGRSGEGMHAKTPWGKPARGKRTRARYRYTSSLIIKRRK